MNLPTVAPRQRDLVMLAVALVLAMSARFSTAAVLGQPSLRCRAGSSPVEQWHSV